MIQDISINGSRKKSAIDAELQAAMKTMNAIIDQSAKTGKDNSKLLAVIDRRIADLKKIR